MIELFLRQTRSPMRSILSVCEPSAQKNNKKSEVIEGIFCQTRSGVRSILSVLGKLQKLILSR